MKKGFINSLTTLFLLTMVFVPAYLVLAQAGGGSGGTQGGGGSGTTAVTAKIDNPFKFGGTNPTLVDFFTAILQNIVLPIGGVLAVLAFIYAGFLYVTAQGNEAKISKAHTALLYTAIGTAVLLGSAAIAKVIEGTISQLK